MESSDEDDDRFFDADEDAVVPRSVAHQLLSADSRVAASFASNAPRSAPAKSHRYSQREQPPPIPPHFLETGRPAAIYTHPQQAVPSIELEHDHDHDHAPARDTLRAPASSERPSTSGSNQSTAGLEESRGRRSRSVSVARNAIGAEVRGRLADRSRKLPPRPLSIESSKTSQVDLRTLRRLESRPRSISGISMARMGRERGGDLFLELADNQAEGDGRNEEYSRTKSAASRAMKRRSLPADATISPLERMSYGSATTVGRTRSRMHSSTISSEFQRHMDRYSRPPGRVAGQADDSVSVSGLSNSGRSNRRFSLAPERSPLSPSRLRSPDMQHLNRTRLSASLRPEHELLPNKSIDSQDESPAESSEPKQTDSNSADSQTADTVWDELDDLKSRIKKLELTKKMPSTSSGAVSGDSSERPRTATTAPTTIDSSPKHERKSALPTNKSTPTAIERPGSATSSLSSHPILLAALDKARPLLHGTLYRTLEATASDAMQLVAMTSGSGFQSATFPANTDRQIKRKADMMCRNLTDLCLALCDGKHESSSFAASPISLDPPRRSSPSMRYGRQSLEPGAMGIERPLSRLEARRSSILGITASSPLGTSPRETFDDQSASEQESTPSLSHNEPRRISRAPSTLLRTRLQRQDEPGIEDDPTVRPPSRAMTDISALRARSTGGPSSALQQMTPKSRETSVARHGSEVAADANRELSRVSSFGSEPRRRHFFEHSTPPVAEEDHSSSGEQPQSRRRITSFGLFRNRRSATDLAPGRASSLTQRRHVIVE